MVWIHWFFFFLTQVEILCNDELLGKSHTLKFVAVTRWRVKVTYMKVWNNTQVLEYFKYQFIVLRCTLDKNDLIIHTYCIKIGRRNFSLQDSTKILTTFFFISGCAFDTSLQEENNWFVTSLFIYGLHNLCWVIYDISKWMPLSVTEYVDKTVTVNDSLLLTVTILTKCWVTVSDSNFFLNVV